MKVEFRELEPRRYVLKVIGYTCPFPTLYTLKALNKISPGDTLEVLTDSRPSCETIPETVRERGHEVLGVEQVESTLWKVRIRRRL